MALLTGGRRAPTANVSFGELYRDPYPAYRVLRKKAPVAAAPLLGGWIVSRFDDVKAVLSDDELFSSGIPNRLPASLRPCIFLADGTEHTRQRAAYRHAFSPRAARAVAESVTADAAYALIDEFPAGEPVELVDGFCEPVAAAVAARLLGLEGFPRSDLRRWHEPLGCQFMLEAPPAALSIAYEINDEVDSVLGPHLAALETAPDGSALSSGFASHGSDSPLNEDERLATAKVIFFSAVQEFRDLLSQSLLALLTHPAQLELVREDVSLLDAAVDEAARWASPVNVVPRLTRVDTDLAGTTVPKSSVLAVAIGSANRDQRRWTDPDLFDVRRDEGMHLAFATGPHFCLGAWVARSGIPIAIQCLLERAPGLRLAPGETPLVRGWTFRGARRLVAELA